MPAHHTRRPTARRPAALALTLLSLIAALLTGRAPERVAGQAPELRVHEWGTFTTVSGRDGGALAWRPLGVESDLPSFVYSVDRGVTWQGTRLRYQTKSASFVRVRMETPVIYFYAPRETAVSVKVGFPRGKITEWYPRAQAGGRGIDWGRLSVLPGAQAELPHDRRENHYYPARETDAALLRISGEGQQTEHEKFLFYRGVGDFALPLFVKLGDGRVAVRSADGGAVGRVILFESRGGKTGHLVADVARAEAVLERPALDGDADSLRRQMRAILISHGLYEKEADAMLDTWRDSWFEPGLRLFYVLPRAATDAILPIDIDPRPSELVRVLVGRAELITPETESDMIRLIRRLDDPSERVRAAALEGIRKHGRFTEQILTQVLEHATDARLRSRVERLLGELTPRAAVVN